MNPQGNGFPGNGFPGGFPGGPPAPYLPVYLHVGFGTRDLAAAGADPLHIEREVAERVAGYAKLLREGADWQGCRELVTRLVAQWAPGRGAAPVTALTLDLRSDGFDG